MKIGLAKKKDAEEILEYLRETDNNFKKGDKNCERFTRNRIEYFLKNNLIVLVRDNGIKGHLFAEIRANPNLGVIEFEAVYLREKYRGKGIGTKLIKESVKYIKKHFENIKVKPRCIYVLTRSNNKVAIRVYEKAGFKKQNTIGKIYRDDQPEELVMVKFFNVS